MAQPIRNKIHTRIGHERSLCGLTPRNGHAAAIKPFAEFFAAADDAQCGTCLRKAAQHGYKITELRTRYRAAQPEQAAPTQHHLATASEIGEAYRRSTLRQRGITLLKALMDDAIYQQLTTQALAQRECTRIHTEVAAIQARPDRRASKIGAGATKLKEIARQETQAERDAMYAGAASNLSQMLDRITRSQRQKETA